MSGNALRGGSAARSLVFINMGLSSCMDCFIIIIIIIIIILFSLWIGKSEIQICQSNAPAFLFHSADRLF